MSSTVTNNNQQQVFEDAFKAYLKKDFNSLTIPQIGLLAQIQKITCKLNRTFLLNSNAAYFNALATPTSSAPYQGRKG